ncbi:sugar phosphate isomerase/epimerase family protein [Arenibacter algicola]|jgi:sugar phosphate isomerase/epimerase|uniref:Inosose dehydratase n=1 Tax=Arenibacter algicola TaxID=616991 RepID=A0A221UR80_9FLAO|nr:sugar phosphate isomerase/epimerase [Arenibacter algicola]ASO03688.1 inosose dehydratase [Arenibacter algicola]|tara:strand:- start:3946 stop:4776 length:831 start_codon:yes stop_codon:yes gene_type:complete
MKKLQLLWLFFIAIVFFGTTNVLAQEVGLQLYSLRNQFKEDIPSTLKLINDWGITVLEGGDSYGMPEEEFKGLLAKNNLKVVSVGAGFNDLANAPEEVVKKAKSYGATYVMCAWIPHDGNNFDISDTQKAVEVFNRAGKILRDNGIKLAYHAHGFEFRPYKDGTLFDYMAQNAKYFDFEMDVYWVHHGGEDPLKLLKKYPSKFILLHLKDMEKGTKKDNTGHADVETNVVLGTGEVDIAGVVAEAKKLGIKYMFIEDECSRVVEQVPKSLRYLEGL